MNKPTHEVVKPVVLTEIEELEPIIAPQGIIVVSPITAGTALIGTFTVR